MTSWINLADIIRSDAGAFRTMAIGEGSRYLAATALMFSLLAGWRLWSISRFKIRASYPRASQIGREALNSLRTIVVYQVTYLSIATLAGFAHIWAFGTLDSLPVFILSFPVILLAHDAYFYWAHRLMHARRVYAKVHWEHHRSNNPSPFTSYSFSVSEAVIEGAFLPIYVLVVPTWPSTVLFFVVFQVIYNVAIHSGIEWFPRLLVTNPVLGWFAGTTHHDLHHRGAGANYGLYFRIWDRLMRTEHPRFVDVYEYVRANRAPTDAYSVVLHRSWSGGASAPPISNRPVSLQSGGVGEAS